MAAACNTPLADIVFAIEGLTRLFEARASGTTLTAVILSGPVLAFVSQGPTYGTGYEQPRSILVNGVQLPPSYAAQRALATLLSYLSDRRFTRRSRAVTARSP